MNPSQIDDRRKLRPFMPFRIHMSNGSCYDVYHPDLKIVTTRQVIIAFREKKGELPDRTIYCDPLHVTRIEPLNGAKKKRQSKKKDD